MAFSKTSVFVVENTVYVLTGGAIGEKISVFENIRICVNGVLNKGNHERYVVWISVAN